MMIGSFNPGDVVALEADDGVRVYEVGNVFGCRWRKGVRSGEPTDVLVNRLDVDTLRPTRFDTGYAFESSLVDATVDVELVASVAFMRGLRRARAITAGRVAAFETAAARDGEVDVDPLQRQQSNAASAAALESWALDAEVPF